MLQIKPPKTTWENKCFPMKWPWTNWKSGNSTQAPSIQRHKNLHEQIKVHPSVNISPISWLSACLLVLSSELCQPPWVSTHCLWLLGWTEAGPAGMDGGRTCWVGRHPHQPAEVSSWLNCTHPTANKPEWGILCIYNGVGKNGAGLRYLDLGNIFPDCSARFHQSPISTGCHGQGTTSLGGSMCRDHVGTRGERGEDMGFWGFMR